MEDQNPDIWSALAAPFDPGVVQATTTPDGKTLKGIPHRHLVERLNTVLGLEGWSDEYIAVGDSVCCRIKVILPDGTPVMRSDGGGSVQGGSTPGFVRGVYAAAFARAAAKFGIGLYLYPDSADHVAMLGLPATPTGPSESPPSAPAVSGDGNYAKSGTSKKEGASYGVPKTGRALFAWTKEQEDHHGHQGLLKYINNWGKLQEYDGRMVDWSAAQVAAAHEAAVAKIQKSGG